MHWKDWCWSWNSNTLATWCEELTHLKRQWCWERLKAGGEGDDRDCDGWMASLTQWTWVWVNSGGWWWTGRPGVLQSMGSQIVGDEWATELNWAESQCWGLTEGIGRETTWEGHWHWRKSTRVGVMRLELTPPDFPLTNWVTLVKFFFSEFQLTHL